MSSGAGDAPHEGGGGVLAEPDPPSPPLAAGWERPGARELLFGFGKHLYPGAWHIGVRHGGTVDGDGYGGLPRHRGRDYMEEDASLRTQGLHDLLPRGGRGSKAAAMYKVDCD